MKNVLIISGDLVGNHMGGVGVRYWELAHALAPHCRVTLAVPHATDLQSEQVSLVPFDLEHGDIRELARQADVMVTHGFVVHHHPYLRDLGIPMAVDLYVPYLLESLVWHAHDPLAGWIPAYEEYLRVQLELLRYGDFFFCASERQRDYWLGWLHAQKRINPHTYLQDPSLRKLIDILPFGIQAGSPQRVKPVLKGVYPGIGETDRLLLWAGGVWDWLDPLTPIRAMAELAPRFPDLKLYFLGTRHPNPVVANMAMVERAVALSQELGLYNRSVFFGDWVPYHERESFLAEADLSVVAHPGHIETHFSYRTRVLDCIWAGLPLIITDGDAMSDLVKQEDLGAVVAPGDVQGMAAAIERVLFNLSQTEYYANSFDELREQLRWSRVIAPLLDFCLNPALAADKGQYLTEQERILRDKDAYISRVIVDKDAYIDAIIRDRDERFDQIGRDWQAYLERVVQDRVDFYEQKLSDQTKSYEQGMADLQRLTQERDVALQQVARYQSHFVYKTYRFFKNLLKG